MAGQLMTSKEWGDLTVDQRGYLIDTQDYGIVKGAFGPWRPDSDKEGHEEALREGHSLQGSEIVVANRNTKGLVMRKASGTDNGVSYPLMKKTGYEVPIPKGTQGRMTAFSMYAATLEVKGQPPLYVVRKNFDVLRKEWRVHKHWWGPTLQNAVDSRTYAPRQTARPHRKNTKPRLSR